MTRIPDPVEIVDAWYVKLPDARISTYDFDNVSLDGAIEILRSAAEGRENATFVGDGDYDESWITVQGYRRATQQEIHDYIARQNDREERKRQNAERRAAKKAADKAAADQRAIKRIMDDAALQYQMAKELANARA